TATRVGAQRRPATLQQDVRLDRSIEQVDHVVVLGLDGAQAQVIVLGMHGWRDRRAQQDQAEDGREQGSGLLQQDEEALSYTARRMCSEPVTPRQGQGRTPWRS